jgi:hypothetical protein
MSRDASSFHAAVRVELDVPATVCRGSPVPIIVRLINPLDRPIDLTLRGRTIAFDVVVRHAGGRVIWRRLGGVPVEAIARLEVLGARETLALRADWSLDTDAGDAVDAGAYEVEGVVFTDGADLRTRRARLQVVIG